MSGPLAKEFSLDPARVHLNHGSFGALPRAVRDYQNQVRRELEADPMYFFTVSYEERLYASLDELASFVNASADDMVLVPNATHGVNAVLQSLRFSPGDELLVTNHAYNACRQCLEAVAERDGAQVVVAELPFPPQNSEKILAAVLERVSAKTKICLLDHITSPTAVILPVRELTAALQSRDVLVLVDGAHVPGMIPLDIKEIGADFYTANCHKWLCSPRGAAFLYVKPEHQERIHPVVTGHGRNSPRTDRSRFQLEFHWTGTTDPSAWCCIGKTLEWLEALMPGGIPAVQKQNHEMAVAMRDYLCDQWGTPPLVPENMMGSMAVVQLPKNLDFPPQGKLQIFDDNHPIYLALREFGIIVPVIAWPEPMGDMVRISCQVYNEKADYERLSEFIVGRLRSVSTTQGG
jgi:isopenicillin-N epimerase